MDLLLRFKEPGTDRKRLRRLVGRVSVGRAVPDGHLWLDAPTVAPLHAEIDATGEGAPVVRLLAPGGALFVNGAFVTEAPLSPGDEVAFGDVAVAVLDGASLAPAAPAPPRPPRTGAGAAGPAAPGSPPLPFFSRPPARSSRRRGGASSSRRSSGLTQRSTARGPPAPGG